ncbi:MAG: PIN domain-containing protein [Proteobacteria bacterium]|nr:PIN domain-containing protein [Pseudomonadota bacterium]MBU2228676.1 PIN domain-containing protein [Pseudomonadota bacterium]MBU2260602.1 PIN domain-containing protein [Pseudomonadota bacterium]
MVLVDTSVWVTHFREVNAGLASLLNDGKAVCHPLVIGELACGNLMKRSEILSLLRALPSVIVAEHNEVIAFIEKKSLMGKGLGFIDMHLLTSALLSRVTLWTFDKKLNQIAALLGLAY